MRDTGPNARVAVVTGGNRGIGLAVCRQLAAAGGRVVQPERFDASVTVSSVDAGATALVRRRIS